MGETMNSLFAAIRHNLEGLFRFTGRDTRDQFWPYAGFVLLLLFILTAAVMLPPIASVVARMHRFAVQHPEEIGFLGEAAARSAAEDEHRSQLMPNVQGIVQPMIFLSALAVFLLGAATVRRLHDRGSPGFWALPPLVFLLIGLTQMPRLYRNFASAPDADFTLFYVLVLNNLLYLLSLLLLVALLARPGTHGANRFGPDPRKH